MRYAMNSNVATTEGFGELEFSAKNVRKNASHFVGKNVGSWMIFVDVLGMTFPETSSKRTEDRPPPKGNDRISIVFHFQLRDVGFRSVSSRFGTGEQKTLGILVRFHELQRLMNLKV